MKRLREIFAEDVYVSIKVCNGSIKIVGVSLPSELLEGEDEEEPVDMQDRFKPEYLG